MDVSFCGTDRRWWVHALSLSTGGFLSSGVTECPKLFLDLRRLFTGSRLYREYLVTPANGQHGYVSTNYVQALRATRGSGRSGATMKDILHATVVSHQRTPGICWNVRSLHIPALWMPLYSSTKQGNSV